MDSKPSIPTISFRHVGDELEIQTSGHTRVHKESDGKYSAYMMGLDIYFSASSEEEIIKSPVFKNADLLIL